MRADCLAQDWIEYIPLAGSFSMKFKRAFLLEQCNAIATACRTEAASVTSETFCNWACHISTKQRPTHAFLCGIRVAAPVRVANVPVSHRKFGGEDRFISSPNCRFGGRGERKCLTRARNQVGTYSFFGFVLLCSAVVTVFFAPSYAQFSSHHHTHSCMDFSRKARLRGQALSRGKRGLKTRVFRYPQKKKTPVQ